MKLWRGRSECQELRSVLKQDKTYRKFTGFPDRLDSVWVVDAREGGKPRRTLNCQRRGRVQRFINVSDTLPMLPSWHCQFFKTGLGALPSPPLSLRHQLPLSTIANNCYDAQIYWHIDESCSGNFFKRRIMRSLFGVGGGQRRLTVWIVTLPPLLVRYAN